MMVSSMDDPIKSIKKREGFPGERISRLSKAALKYCAMDPIIADWYPTSCGSFPQADAHWVHRPRGQDSHILMFCSSGRGFVGTEAQQLDIPLHHMVLIPAQRAHRYGTHPHANQWGKYWVQFTGRRSDLFVHRFQSEAELRVFKCAQPLQLQACFEKLIHAAQDAHTSDQLLRLSQLCQYTLFEAHHLKLHQVHHRSAPNKDLGEVLQHIKTEFQEPLDLRAICSMLGVSQPTLFRHFKKKTGKTPIQYLTQVRMQKACELLDLTHDSIIDIAGQVGYGDPHYFSRVFAQTMGESPKAYRHRIDG